MTNTFRSLGLIALVLPLTLFAEALPAKRLALKTKLDAIRVEAVCLALQDMESQWPGATSFKAETLQPQLDALTNRLATLDDPTVETDAEKLLSEVRTALLSLPALKDAKLLLIKRGASRRQSCCWSSAARKIWRSPPTGTMYAAVAGISRMKSS